MKLAKSGEIQNVCQPNALLTFKEYLMDYADEETKEIGKNTITENLAAIKNEDLRRETAKRLIQIEEGVRDLFF